MYQYAWITNFVYVIAAVCCALCIFINIK